MRRRQPWRGGAALSAVPTDQDEAPVLELRRVRRPGAEQRAPLCRPGAGAVGRLVGGADRSRCRRPPVAPVRSGLGGPRMKPQIVVFLQGVCATGAWAIGLILLRYRRETQDRLFAFFALAFWVLAISWTWLAVSITD